jgi:hypothetical protein
MPAGADVEIDLILANSSWNRSRSRLTGSHRAARIVNREGGRQRSEFPEKLVKVVNDADDHRCQGAAIFKKASSQDAELMTGRAKLNASFSRGVPAARNTA